MLTQTTAFLNALAPHADTFLFTAFHENGKPQIVREPLTQETLNGLHTKNDAGYSIYFLINETACAGVQRTKKDITQLELLKKLRDEAMSEKGQAQEATRLRNVKMEELEDYCYELKTIAMLELEDQPQLLEMLGILVRS